jgi:hypothetical protein
MLGIRRACSVVALLSSLEAGASDSDAVHEWLEAHLACLLKEAALADDEADRAELGGELVLMVDTNSSAEYAKSIATPCDSPIHYHRVTSQEENDCLA